MENASKALIIAGAILLAILLISLGILIFNQAQDTVNNNGMSQAEITSHNNKFLKYEGIQKGTIVKSMINEILTENESVDQDISITLIKKDGSREGSIDGTSLILPSSSYKVEATNYSAGYISAITITEQPQ